MVEEYKVRSGFKCNPWAIKKLSGLQLCAFICPCHADPSAATILPSHFWILIQIYSPSLSLPGVGAPSDTVVHVYSLVFFMSWNKSLEPPSPLDLLAAPDIPTSEDAKGRWVSSVGHWGAPGSVKKGPGWIPSVFRMGVIIQVFHCFNSKWCSVVYLIKMLVSLCQQTLETQCLKYTYA